MAGLILERRTREFSLFHHLESLPFRVGRAPDNDLMLEDPTVSAHHIEIRVREDSALELVDLGSENGVRLNKRLVRSQAILDTFPAEIQLGHTQLRILDANAPVAATRLIGCRGPISCLFESPTAAVLLALLAIAFQLLNFWIEQTSRVELTDLAKTTFLLVLGLAGTASVISIFQRLSSGRWGVASSLGLVAIVSLAAQALTHTGQFANYALTAAWPNIALIGFWTLLVLPLLLWFVLIEVRHVPKLAGAIAILVLCGLASIEPVKRAYVWLAPASEYHAFARYSTELWPWDLRLKQTMSIDEFTEAGRALQAGDAVNADLAANEDRPDD